jgi:hypothetical protein
MSTKDSQIERIQRALDRGASRPHQASAIAMEIFRLRLDRGDADAAVRALVARFVGALPAWGMADLIARQMHYARTLAESNGALEYEEMHKLFSLCDEIRALQALGLAADRPARESLETALRARFSAERKKARMVAEDKAEVWNRDAFWYTENLNDAELG